MEKYNISLRQITEDNFIEAFNLKHLNPWVKINVLHCQERRKICLRLNIYQKIMGIRRS